jgi:ABC-2 type transport system permease protein
VLTRSKSHPPRVGVVGVPSASLRTALDASAASVGTQVTLIVEANAASATSALRAGDVDVVIESNQLLVNKELSATDGSDKAQFTRAAARTLGIEEAYSAARLSPTQASILAQATPLPVNSLQPAKTKGTVRTTSVVTLILVFVMLSQYNTWTLIGVVEEKSSRVVEVLLAAVRPMQLLTGKVLGIGLVAFAQAALILAFALGLAQAVGSDLLHGTGSTALVSTLVWLVLGYAFYCWVYAAAGSTAERQEQVQTLAFPLALPLILGYVLSLTAATSGNASAFFTVLAYLPPTAPFAMPVLVGLGKVTWWQFGASVAISIISTVLVARLATRIYRRAILRTGRRVRLRDVISAKTGA